VALGCAMRRNTLVSFCALLLSCSPFPMDIGDPSGDGGPEAPDNRCNDMTPCPGQRRCVNNVCIPDNGTCTTPGADDACLHDSQGNLKAQIPTPESGSCAKDYPPAIANLDGVGPAEVIMGGQVARYTGGVSPRIDVVWSVPPSGGTWGTISIAEDLDGDGRME